MPRRVEFTPALIGLIRAQDGVVTTGQLFQHGVGKDPVRNRVERRQWRRLLPGVLLTHGGEPTRRQRLMAASLWAGDASAVDGASACAHYGLKIARFMPEQVHVVTPFGATSARSREWVRVRRSLGEIDVTTTARLRYVVEPVALLVAARDVRNEKAAIAMLSRGLQTGLTTTIELQAAREMLGTKWCKPLDAALVALDIGLRSPSEKLFRDLAMTSKILPEPVWNQWLDLGDGGWPVCADGLWKEAAMLHEINGRAYHAWAEQFESTSARMERVAAAGLMPTQSTPLRLYREGHVILANLERTYGLYVGRGMPANVRLIDPPDWAAA